MNGVNADEALMKNLPAVSWTLLLSTLSHWVLSWHNNNTLHVPPPALHQNLPFAEKNTAFNACVFGPNQLYTDGNNREKLWVTVWVLGHPEVNGRCKLTLQVARLLLKNIIQNKCMYMATLWWCHSSKMCPIMSENSDITTRQSGNQLKSYCLYTPLLDE